MAFSKLQTRLTASANSIWVIPALLLIEVVETTILPLPYEALFIALCAVARNRIWLFVLVTASGSAIAGAIMYGLGATFAESVAQWLGSETSLADLKAVVQDRGVSFILLGGTTPAPSYLINLAAGASGFPFWQFLSLFTISRLARFAALGAVIYFYGETIATYWERLPKWLRWTVSLFLVFGITYWLISGVI